MRIISNFKDYYDCIQGLDQEPEPRFIRTEITEKYNGGFML